METSLPEENAVTIRQHIKAQSRVLLRQAVLDVAQRLLVQEGSEALTVRRLAAELQCSTKILYTLFQGKDGVANALYREGCRLLAEAMQSIPPLPDARDYVQLVATAYQAFAADHEPFYRVMFCGAIPKFRPDAASTDNLNAAFSAIIEQFDRLLEAGQLHAEPLRQPGQTLTDAHMILKAFWAPLHGIITLQLLGHLSDNEASSLYTSTIKVVLNGLST